MRSQVIRSVRNASSVLSVETTGRQVSRKHAGKLFTCAQCRATAPSQAQRASFATSSTRPFTTTTASYRNSNSTHSSERPIPQAPQTHYDFFPQTFPAGPPPNAAFSPDLRQLRKEFLQLQAKSHPDLAPSNRKSHAEALSARINEAYKTLQDPLRRAQYLLAQQGIDVEDESAKLDAAGGGDAELLMEVMEAREAVEDVEEEEDLAGIREENNTRIAESVAHLETAFGAGDLEGAAREAVKLRYWMNIEESIHGWEKGKGGGVIHH
ncbi:Putative DnaJ domain, co-chaperone Hsc20, co-chaperone HscB oligomerization [Septoria linicola]|uniref:DnaJ domain, co-chaperone Hsc20, co-chaperone HscB oligomerization n=1 Tax=Septoria linicola TaxID=215465 RepID=A0A9Q9AKW1_9PEZI|nr:putative DnaJ domain, co-chaperone Hsc20, co-chaperone HscB oligomerization [Septoria linicola]USW47826.1 Putative DnaJ domain, co-chaperone Hsc20, co-chaperone HscB oligomerization [Septoria linicola]